MTSTEYEDWEAIFKLQKRVRDLEAKMEEIQRMLIDLCRRLKKYEAALARAEHNLSRKGGVSRLTE